MRGRQLPKHALMAAHLRTQGYDLVEPGRWPDDGGARREPVLDYNADPRGRVVRRVGWVRCMRCRRPAWSGDVVRCRICVGCGGLAGPD
ncbi:hypothetical protein CCZ28_15570 [Pseudomonas oryzihabitans]|nr:hypothetical protein CCZ28_15570 [Pseudomonas psychrotolerans]